MFKDKEARKKALEDVKEIYLRNMLIWFCSVILITNAVVSMIKANVIDAVVNLLVWIGGALLAFTIRYHIRKKEH